MPIVISSMVQDWGGVNRSVDTFWQQQRRSELQHLLRKQLGPSTASATAKSGSTRGLGEWHSEACGTSIGFDLPQTQKQEVQQQRLQRQSRRRLQRQSYERNASTGDMLQAAAAAQPSCSVLPLPPLERVQTARRDDRLLQEQQRRHRQKERARRARARILLMQPLSTAHSSPSEVHHAEWLAKRREVLDLTVDPKQADMSLPEEREGWTGKVHDSPKQQHWQIDGTVQLGTDIAVAPRAVMTPPSSLFADAVATGLDSGTTAREVPAPAGSCSDVDPNTSAGAGVNL